MTESPHDTDHGAAGDLPVRFGCYRVEALIGTGGMGKVYRALDEALNRHVALKTLLPTLAADPEFVARFKREAQSAAALNHANITQIYAIGQEGAIPFFAMEMIHGRSLESLVKQQGALDPLVAARYVIQAAEGLRHAAQKGLIHRDIKPSNLMLTEDGVVKITDFGLAKAARAESQLTVTGEVLGSPGYISPEQAQGGPLDLRTDIYSLGATFFNLVTGRMPFEAPTAVAMIMKHLNEPLRSPRALNPAISYPLGAAIQKMMAKRSGERFRDYEALIRELERCVQVPSPRATGVAAGHGMAPGRKTSAAIGSRPARASGSRPAVPEPEVRSGSFPWIPAALVLMLGVLATAAVRQHLARATSPSAAPEGTANALPAAAGPATTPSQGAPTTSVSGSPNAPRRGGFVDRMRHRLAPRSRANLTIVSNDHEFLPEGGLRVIGTVRNSGGRVATEARIRARILLKDGSIAAQQESPLDPDTLGPGEVGMFDVLVDYSGPIGTIRAEVHWTD